jgi:hypothetical protein
MHIQLLKPIHGPIIAREWIDNVEHGIFYLTESGEVHYRFDNFPQRYANASIMHFQQSAACWHRYQHAIREQFSEQDQFNLAQQFQTQLCQIDPTVRTPESFWDVIMEQMLDGMI